MPSNSRFNFLCLCNLLKRKNVDILLDAFDDEFRGGDVGLGLLYNDTFNLFKHYESLLTSFCKNNSNIFCKKLNVPRNILVDIYNGYDVFVLATSGEGFCMPAMESLACEKPVIITGWGTIKDIYNEMKSVKFIDYKLVDISLSNMQPQKCYLGHKWALPDYFSLRKSMRDVYQNYTFYCKFAKQDRKRVELNYDINVIASQVVKEYFNE